MTIADHPAGRLYVPGQPTPTVPQPSTEQVPSVVDAVAPPHTGAIRPLTWSQVDTGFSVASRAGEYVGSVDTTPNGTFVAFDSTNAPIGHYPTLAEAKRAVLTWRAEPARVRERRLAQALRPVAAGAGLIAAVTAAMGALLAAFPN